jgi:type I restriction enzyme S subunit
VPAGKLPSGWRMVKFGDVVRQVSEAVRDPAAERLDRVVGLEHIDSDDLHIKRWDHIGEGTSFTKRFRKGQVLFGRRRAYLRKVAQAEFDGICSGDITVMEPNGKDLLPELLPFLVQTDGFYEHTQKVSAGGLSPRARWRDLATYEFPLPPIPEQRRIAEILWAAESYGTAFGRLQDACVRTEDAMLDAFLSERAGWNTASVGDLVLEGPRNGISPQAEAGGRGLPTLSIGAVREGRVVPDGNLKYANVPESTVRDYFLRPQDILVVRGNGNRDLVARCGVVTALPPRCFYPDLLILLRFDEAKIRQRFAALQWNHSWVHRRLLRKAKSTNGIWKVNGKDLRTHVLLVPPIASQDEFLDQYHSLEEESERLAKLCTAARSVRNGLSVRLLEPVIN